MKPREKAHLKSLGTNLKAVLQVGKFGIHDNLILDIEAYLDKHELMKISLLKNIEFTYDEFKEALEARGITVVNKLGRTVLLYRYSDKLDKHIEF